MKLFALFAVMLFTLAMSPLADAAKKESPAVPPVLNFTMKDIDGKDVNLAEKYAGKTILLVNVASKCGLTKQYTGLQKLYDTYKDKGFVIVGIPANDFGAQEPGSNEDIKEFCSTEYKVNFPMLAKVSVKGDKMAPLYKYLTSKESNGKFGGDITWNFEKFLVNPKGEVVARYAPRTTPEEVGKDIEKNLPASK